MVCAIQSVKSRRICIFLLLFLLVLLQGLHALSGRVVDLVAEMLVQKPLRAVREVFLRQLLVCVVSVETDFICSMLGGHCNGQLLAGNPVVLDDYETKTLPIA